MENDQKTLKDILDPDYFCSCQYNLENLLKNFRFFAGPEVDI